MPTSARPRRRKTSWTGKHLRALHVRPGLEPPAAQDLSGLQGPGIGVDLPDVRSRLA